MRITVTARHCEIADDLRARARERVARVAKLAKRPHHAHVIFTGDHGAAAVDIELHVPRGGILVGKAVAPDHSTALDLAAARVKRQLLDEKEAPRSRRRPPASTAS